MKYQFEKDRKYLESMLKRICLYFPLVLFAFCNTTSESKLENSEIVKIESQIRNVYDQYKKNVSEGNGNAAVQCVSSETIIYYNSLLDMVNNADSSKLETADLLLKFSVLAIRHSVNWGMLRAMNGEKLLKYAIENGMIGREMIKTEIGKIQLNNQTFASGELLIRGKSTGIFADFFKESEIWKVDLRSLLKANELSLKKILQHPNMSENQSIMYILKQTFGTEPGAEVWQPATTNAK